ncbi:MAG: preprotein translocase subunit SecG [Ruminococcus sp.]|jgi:protein translocase SecG subunit|nr:preprotein translocase subunit SecG [Ruminococcus sp.]
MEFGPLQIVSGVLLILLALIIIVLTLSQTPKSQNLGSALGGGDGQDTYFGKAGEAVNRKEAALARLTKFFGVIFFLVVLGVNIVVALISSAAA